MILLHYLLLQGRKAIAIGYTARRLWNELSAVERTDRSHFYLTGAGIKLALHSPREAQPLPAGITPVMAAADFLSMFRRRVMMHLGGTVSDTLGFQMHPDMIKVRSILPLFLNCFVIYMNIVECCTGT